MEIKAIENESAYKFKKLTSKEDTQLFMFRHMDKNVLDSLCDPEELATEDSEEIKDLARKLDEARAKNFYDQHKSLVDKLATSLCSLLTTDVETLKKEGFLDSELRPCDGKKHLVQVSTFDRAAAWCRIVNNTIGGLKNKIATAAKEKRTARENAVIKLYGLLDGNADRHNIILTTYPECAALLSELEETDRQQKSETK